MRMGSPSPSGVRGTSRAGAVTQHEVWEPGDSEEGNTWGRGGAVMGAWLPQLSGSDTKIHR